MKMKEIIAKEEVAQELARQAIKKYEAAAREAAYLKESSEREASERKETKLKVIRAAKEKEKLEDALSGSTPQYRKFLWDEIVSATYLSLKIKELEWEHMEWCISALCITQLLLLKFSTLLESAKTSNSSKRYGSILMVYISSILSHINGLIYTLLSTIFLCC
jgi:hypothetical protein